LLEKVSSPQRANRIFATKGLTKNFENNPNTTKTLKTTKNLNRKPIKTAVLKPKMPFLAYYRPCL